MVEFSSQVLRVFMTINNKSERNDDEGKFLGWPVTSYSPEIASISSWE